jgi:hypothetical protein
MTGRLSYDVIIAFDIKNRVLTWILSKLVHVRIIILFELWRLLIFTMTFRRHNLLIKITSDFRIPIQMPIDRSYTMWYRNDI